MTQGLQAGLNTDTTLIACLKHFVADGGTANGDDRGNAVPSNNELEAVHLYPYLASLDAGAATVMASYSSVNGTPMHAATQLLTGVLKTELGFPGFVVSDWAALDHLPGDRRVQIATAINAGVDMVMVPDDYVPFIRHLTSLVEDGVVSAERINDAVRRILVTKIRMGLFEHAVPNPALEPLVGSAAHRAVARQAVAQSQVLLKNNGVLPLAPDQRVLLVGKAGNSIGIQCGGWTLTWQGTTGNENRGTTILEALVAEVGEVSVTYRDQISERAEVDPADFDVVVFVGGELPYAEGRGDAARPAVSESDVASASMLAELGLPVVSLLISGRPLLLDGIDRHSDALVASWLPGTEAAGITDVLFGHEPFTGTLPFAWPADESGFTQGQPDDVYRYPLGYGLMVPAWSAKGLTTSTP